MMSETENETQLVICSYAKYCSSKGCCHHEPHEFLDSDCEADKCDQSHELVTCKPIVTDWDT